MSELHTEGPTDGVSAPAGGSDPAKEAALAAQKDETEPTATPAGETQAETTGEDAPADAPQDPTEQPADTETPNTTDEAGTGAPEITSEGDDTTGEEVTQ